MQIVIIFVVVSECFFTYILIYVKDKTFINLSHGLMMFNVRSLSLFLVYNIDWNELFSCKYLDSEIVYDDASSNN